MDCGLDSAFGSSEYVAKVFQKACAERVPLCGSFDLTYRCNFRCVHCFAGHLVDQPASLAGELDTDRVVALLDEVAKAGCLTMLLSGGEPLLRPDFLDVYQAAKQAGLIVTVFTNASLVTDAHVEKFADLPPHAVEISVYGATKDTYERITGVQGSFERAHRGISLLLEGGINVVLKTMILRDNSDEVLLMEQWAEGLGVPFRLDPMITPRLDGDCRPLEQRVDPEMAVSIELASLSRRYEWTKFLRDQEASGRVPAAPAYKVYRCGAGLASFSIDPTGHVHPCVMSRGISADAGRMGFVAAWESVASEVDLATWEGVGGCADCPSIFFCGYCPGLFELEKTSAARPPEYACKVGESRIKVIGNA